MENIGDMLRCGNHDAIWQKYCGFLDLDINGFMMIQERLLMEQIELLSQCQLGKEIMGEDTKPKTVGEFRRTVPLTTYEDYAEYLLNKRGDVLPEEPKYWIQTTWKGGQYPIKLAPYSEGMINEHAKAFVASLILATSKKRGHFSLSKHDKFLFGMAPLPYLTGLTPYGLNNEIELDYLPPIQEAENLGFEERNLLGFELGMSKGIDLFFGLSSILVKIGESFVNNTEKSNNSFKIPSNPRMAYRLIKAGFKKRFKKQPILPKDIWNIKGLICAGTDTAAFKEKIEYYWGKEPLEIYGGTEIATAATGTLGSEGLTFFPDVNFLEFIPEKECLKSLNDPNFEPKTLLLNEIKPNERYELVITKFRGGAFIRYRIGDMIECVALENEAYQIKLPQIKYVDRISNVIDLAGFTRITKDTISKALALSKLTITDWIACKEYIHKEPNLHIYLELDQYSIDEQEIKEKVNYSLKEVDSDFKDIQALLNRDPLKVTLLRPNTFRSYIETMGAIFNQLNPGEDVVEKLITISQNI